MDTASTPPPCAHCCGRRDLHLRLEGDAATLEDGALDRPIRWVHSSDLADPTPFLSEGLALLTTGTQFQDAGDDPSVYADYVAPTRGPRRASASASAPRWCAPASRPLLADACRAARMPLFEVPVPHAVHRGRARQRGGDRRAVVRAAQLGPRRSARDLPRRAAARRTGRDARRAGPPARRLGRDVRRGRRRSPRASRRGARAGRGGRAARRGGCGAARGARARHRRFGSATRPSRCRRSVAAVTCAA